MASEALPDLEPGRTSRSQTRDSETEAAAMLEQIRASSRPPEDKLRGEGGIGCPVS